MHFKKFAGLALIVMTSIVSGVGCSARPQTQTPVASISLIQKTLEPPPIENIPHSVVKYRHDQSGIGFSYPITFSLTSESKNSITLTRRIEPTTSTEPQPPAVVTIEVTNKFLLDALRQTSQKENLTGKNSLLTAFPYGTLDGFKSNAEINAFKQTAGWYGFSFTRTTPQKMKKRYVFIPINSTRTIVLSLVGLTTMEQNTILDSLNMPDQGTLENLFTASGWKIFRSNYGFEISHPAERFFWTERDPEKQTIVLAKPESTTIQMEFVFTALAREGYEPSYLTIHVEKNQTDVEAWIKKHPLINNANIASQRKIDFGGGQAIEILNKDPSLENPIAKVLVIVHRDNLIIITEDYITQEFEDMLQTFKLIN